MSLLSYMVDTANKKFGGGPVTAGAERNAMNVYQTVTIASIVQAEAATKKDMGKVARVVYNRLDRGMPLQMDSTINYALNRSTLRTSENDTRIDSPYNTYRAWACRRRPSPTPARRRCAPRSLRHRATGCTSSRSSPGDTRFTADYEEHQRNVAEFNRTSKKRGAEVPAELDRNRRDPVGRTSSAAAFGRRPPAAA